MHGAGWLAVRTLKDCGGGGGGGECERKDVVVSVSVPVCAVCVLSVWLIHDA